MTKYWNPRRIKRIKERENRTAELAAEKAVALRERTRSHTPGDTRKNTVLILDALGLPLRRRMIGRLKRGGAMSVSKLAEPFRITLPSALEQVRILERSGIISTHKHGRVRLCVYRPQALRELAHGLTTGEVD
ncbi:MAG: helix-turn-helix domain-containing protein [Patescibacteria group bacterium]